MSTPNVIRIISIIIILTVFGCSGIADKPVAPEIPDESPLTVDADDSSRVLWGMWNVQFDQTDLRLTVTPVRNGQFHVDITEMIIPPACDDCFEIYVLSFDPVTRILSANVTLRNPYPINGRDVRGILFTNDAGHRLENPDDWSGLWDAPGGGTLNPFKAYAKSETNRIFAGSAEHTENYHVYIPMPPQYNAITFAVDASWPGNCKEPYAIDDFAQLGILYNVVGHSTTIEVYVRDWQSDVSKVTLVAPEITGQSFTAFTNVSGEKWNLELTNNEGAEAGEHVVRIIADSTNSPGTPLYDYVPIIITEGVQPVITGITPDQEYSGYELTDVEITGSNFEGPGLTVVLRRSGETDIPAYNIVHDSVLITCDISLPVAAAPGLWSVVVTNGTGIPGTGVNLFEMLVKIPDVYGIFPTHGATEATLIDVYVTGMNFQNPGIAVKLKMDGEPFIQAENVWFNEVTVVSFDLNIPFDAALGMYDVEVTNGNGQSGLLEDAFEVHGPVPDNPVDITPDWLNFSPNDVCVEGNYAYVAAGHNGLHIWDVTSPANPVWVNSIDLGSEIMCVAVSGGYAYVGAMEDGLYIVDVDPPEAASYAGYFGTGGYGYGIAVVGNTVYLADGQNDLYIIDVTIPGTPSLLKAVTVPGKSQDVVVENGYAYIAAWDYGLQIVDVDPPASASVVDGVDNSNFTYNVAVLNGYAYLATSGGVRIIDVDPIGSSVEVKYFSTPGRTRDITVVGDYAYIADGSGGMAVADVNPISSASVVHSVVGHGFMGGVTVAGNYAYCTDKMTGLYAIDITTPTSASLSKWLPTAGQPQGIAYDNGNVFIANSAVGVMAYNVSTPGSPEYKAIAWTWEAYCVDAANGYVYVGDGEDEFGDEHVKILDADPVESMSVIKTIQTMDIPYGIVYRDGYVYTAEQSGGLRIYDVDPPGSASMVGGIGMLDQLRDIAVDGEYGYVAAEEYILNIADINPIGDAHVEKLVESELRATGVALYNGHAYVTDNWGYNLLIVDIDPVGDSYIENTVYLGGYPEDVVVIGGYAYVAAGDEGLKIVDVEPIGDASEIASVNTMNHAVDIVVEGNLAFIADQYSGWRIIQLW